MNQSQGRASDGASGAAEQAVVFDCGEAQLPAVLHRPAQPGSVGVLLVVGGPQTRVGSHRQFVLLARDLAGAGHAVFRFDYRGMGDADGDYLGFESIGPDIRAALDCFRDRCPEVRQVVIWGLCDAATAAAFHAHADPRVSGLVLLNPWVRSEQGEAEAYLRHYYLRRLLQPDFWRGLLVGRVRLLRSLGALLGNVARARGGPDDAESSRGGSLSERMAAGLARFRGPVLLVLSGNDLTAQEFVQCAAKNRAWQRILEAPRTQVLRLARANHTFSRREWRDEVSRGTRQWIAAWFGRSDP